MAIYPIVSSEYYYWIHVAWYKQSQKPQQVLRKPYDDNDGEAHMTLRGFVGFCATSQCGKHKKKKNRPTAK